MMLKLDCRQSLRLLGLLGASALSVRAALAAAPVASTLAAGSVTATNAVLQASVNPNGLATTAWFQWGANSLYGNLTTATNAGSGAVAVPVNQLLNGLVGGVAYHYRAVATNSAGTARGADRFFGATFVLLNGSNLTNVASHTSFVDPGATAIFDPMATVAISGHYAHGLALKATARWWAGATTRSVRQPCRSA